VIYPLEIKSGFSILIPKNKQTKSHKHTHTHTQKDQNKTKNMTFLRCASWGHFFSVHLSGSKIQMLFCILALLFPFLSLVCSVEAVPTDILPSTVSTKCSSNKRLKSSGIGRHWGKISFGNEKCSMYLLADLCSVTAC
jgi:hypothetical protein